MIVVDQSAPVTPLIEALEKILDRWDLSDPKSNAMYEHLCLLESKLIGEAIRRGEEELGDAEEMVERLRTKYAS